MIEKLLERWLDDANEKTYQMPFAYSLAKRGYTVVHVSRHCGMELGKDVLAIDDNGIPCAFQLKGTENGRLTLAKWRNEVQPQLLDLVLGQIVHPSINCTQPHRAFLIVNGILEEEVQRSITDFNNARQADGTNKKLEVMLRGD